MEQEFYPVKQIHLSTLNDLDKAQWLDLLIDQNIKLSRASDGHYQANVRLNMFAPSIAGSSPVNETAVDVNVNEEEEEEVETHSEAAVVPSPEDPAKEENLSSDLERYKQYLAIISDGKIKAEGPKPSNKGLAWTHRMMEEVYDSRYEREQGPLSGRRISVASPTGEETLSFPIFVKDFMKKKFGVKKLIDQNLWDLLYTIHILRDAALEVEIFAKFLEESYDVDDLLLFLSIRSVLKKELGTKDKDLAVVVMTRKMCLDTAKSIFGSEVGSLAESFVKKINENFDASSNAKTAMQVMEFQHLILQEYHDVRLNIDHYKPSSNAQRIDSLIASVSITDSGPSSPRSVSTDIHRKLLHILGVDIHEHNTALVNSLLDDPSAADLSTDLRDDVFESLITEVEERVSDLLNAVISTKFNSESTSGVSKEYFDTLCREYQDLILLAHHINGGSAAETAEATLFEKVGKFTKSLTQEPSNVRYIEHMASLTVSYAIGNVQQSY